ncbi:MAG: methylmalonyl Co-A mutase-associated GTPase MeaB [Acidimicrobiales bacterium]
MVLASRSIPDLYEAARSGERRAVGRLLTIVERGLEPADEISELAHRDSTGAHIVGITGAPGAGKSTLVGQLVTDLVVGGAQPAVLAVDPSSPLTGGAILGDRIRMDDAAERMSPGVATTTAFIRSMATRGHSGGLALAVPLAVRLFDACGYAPVIIETVGVGQVEVDVVGAADTAVVVVTPGMGDAVQANKAGLLEVADLFVVNKADRPGANDVRRDLDLMLDLSHMTGQESDTGYRPPIVMASALNGEGNAEVWAAVEKHLAHLDETGQRQSRRRHRVRTEVRARLTQTLIGAADAAIDTPVGAELVAKAEAAQISPTAAATELIDQLLTEGHRP